RLEIFINIYLGNSSKMVKKNLLGTQVDKSTEPNSKTISETSGKEQPLFDDVPILSVEEEPSLKKNALEKNELKEEVFIDVKKKDKIIPANSVSFPCPSCGKSIITRSFQDRRLSTPYQCEKCEFVGPN
ncbi:MAG: zinc finger domain-containing protein, partial [Nanoarchaeota archaeon]